MGEESEADWYSGVRVKMTPNIQLHRSAHRRAFGACRRPVNWGVMPFPRGIIKEKVWQQRSSLPKS